MLAVLSGAALAVVGAVVVCVLMFLKYQLLLKVNPGSLKRFQVKGKKNWVLITGASDGIGKAVTDKFAKSGFNVMMLSRTESKLATLKEELLKKYPRIEIEYLPMDVAAEKERHAKTWAFVDQVLGSDGELRALVNNVGMNMIIPATIDEHEDDEIDAVIDVNVGYTTRMCRTYVARTTKSGRYLLINMGSALGLHPCPYLAVYSASKAYINALSTAISRDRRNLTVKSFTPFYVASPMTLTTRTDIMFISPKKMADLVVAALRDNRIVCNPYWYHALYGAMMSLLPKNKLLDITVKQIRGQQKKILRKMNRTPESKARLAPRWRKD